MRSEFQREPLPLALQRIIDDRCDAYEQAWRAGPPPQLADFVRDVPQEARPHLLLELIIVEIEYARDDRGERVTQEQIIARHPEFASEFAQVLDNFPTIQAPEDLPVKSPPTAPATLRASGSRGLHIRCPHCQVALELLADAPLNAINCSGCGSNFSLIDGEADNSASRTLQHIGRFQLLSRLGVGGFGTVWKAHDAELDRIVALKIPRKGQLTAKEEELFFREARAAAQLRHPNIVPVHEVGRDHDTIFIVSDFILGESLANWLREQHPSTRDMIVLLAKVADALHFAHEHGIVHRDFKPSNVIIDQDGEPHLVDFGLAKREVGEVTMTIDGQVVGTPAYMSPEQAAGSTHWVDRRTDVYSLGVVLFEVLTGELPFRGNAQMQIRERLSADPPNPRRLNQKAPLDLSTISLRCLEREPNRRYSTAHEVAAELRRYLNHEPIQARRISRFGRVIRWSRRNPALAAAACLALFLAIVGPTVALVINYQRSLLAARVDEIQRLVKENEHKLDQRAETIQALTHERDALLGIAAEDSRETQDAYYMAAQHLMEHSQKTVFPLLEGTPTRLDQKARGQLGFAYLLAAVNSSDAAKLHLTSAIDALQTLVREDPLNPAWQLGLAECHRMLVALHTTDNAPPNIVRAANSHAGWHGRDPESADVLRAKSALATIQRLIDKKEPNPKERISALRDELLSAWPTDLDGLYEVACFLTDHDRVLTQNSAKAVMVPSD